MLQLDQDSAVVEAIAVTDLVENEQRWLEVAARCYSTQVFERLVKYSTDRVGKFISAKTRGICKVAAVVLQSDNGPRVVFRMAFANHQGIGVRRAILRLQQPDVRA